MNETEIKREITRQLESLGCIVVRVQAGRRGRYMVLAKPGAPDLCVLCPGGVTLWIETKTGTGKLSDTQLAWHARATRMEHQVVVCRDAQEALDAVARALILHRPTRKP